MNICHALTRKWLLELKHMSDDNPNFIAIGALQLMIIVPMPVRLV